MKKIEKVGSRGERFMEVVKCMDKLNEIIRKSVYQVSMGYSGLGRWLVFSVRGGGWFECLNVYVYYVVVELATTRFLVARYIEER